MLPLAQQCEILTDYNKDLLNKVISLKTQTKTLITGLVELEKTLERAQKERPETDIV
jgi:hypothetical protein